MVCDAAAVGPRLVAVNAYVYAPPAAIGSGASTTVNCMSEAFCAVVLSETLTLFDVLGSVTADVAVTTLVHTPGVGRMTWIVTVALARNVSVPSAQLTTPAAGGLQEPCVVDAPTNVDPG